MPRSYHGLYSHIQIQLHSFLNCIFMLEARKIVRKYTHGLELSYDRKFV